MTVHGSKEQIDEAKAQTRRVKLLIFEAFENSEFWKFKMLPEIHRKLDEQGKLSRKLDQPQSVRDGAAGAVNEIEKLLEFIAQERRALEKRG